MWPFTIPAFAAGRPSTSELTRLREQCDHCVALLDETHATLASQAAQLAELQERLDFAERVLTQSRHRATLEPGETSS